MGKRLLSWMLTVAMLLGFCQIPGLHAQAENDEEFTITFKDHFTQSEPYTQVYHAGDTVVLEPNRFLREGYYFFQWINPENNHVYRDCGKLTIPSGSKGENITLCATWTPRSGFLNGGARWDINDAGVLTIHAGTLGNYSNGSWPWSLAHDHITGVAFDGNVIARGEINSMFQGLKNITSLDLSSLDTSSATNMINMFSGCSNLENINLTGFVTSSVTKMGWMFNGCSKLSSLDLSMFDTSKVTDMRNMFSSCRNLPNLNLESFDTSNVTQMSGMFEGCGSLTELDLSKFDTKRVTTMGSMFNGCVKLTNLNLSRFDTSNVTNMSMMFGNCSSLTVLDLSHFHTPKLTHATDMFTGCSKLISLDLSCFDTSHVINMSSMFSGCNKLAHLNLSNFDTSSVTSMWLMFYDCWALEDLNISSFNTKNVTNMAYMFTRCKALKSLDLSSFDASKVTTMGMMFNGCRSLASVKLGEKFKFVGSNSELPTPPTTLPFFGKWALDTGGSAYTAVEMRNRYPSGEMVPGTYVWAIKTYPVTFNMNGHGTAPATQLIKHGEKAVAPEEPEVNGYIFGGWYTDAQCSLSYNFNTAVIQNRTLYAKWSHNGVTHTATFIADNEIASVVTFAEGDSSLAEPDVPEKEGYTGAWESYDLMEANSDITINAEYTPIPIPMHSIYFVADDTEIAAIQFQEGTASIEEPVVPVKEGYAGEWAEYDLQNATSDITVNAIYTPLPKPTYTATFIADDNVVALISFTEDDESLEEPLVPAKDGYSGEWESYSLLGTTHNIVITAIYVQIPVPTHIASFVADNETVGTVTFTEGDESLNEPDVPAKDGYTGAWEPYDLAGATADITVRAIYTAIPKPTHTATFRIGDTVIATVPFTEGDTALDEPRIPDKPNYVGAWDAYNLANAKTDITVEGRYTPVDPDAVSDLGGDAEASYDNGVVTITLRASAPSQTIKVTSEQARPVDVVLVLDQSGSMQDTLGGRQSKRDALVSCANSFVQQLHQNAVTTGANHRVALVGFAYDAYNNGKYVNTGLLATASGTGKNYTSLKASDYAAALLPINNNGSINANVLAGIRSIAAEGATSADLGLKMAKNIFSENSANGERERIVVFITDGTPTCWGETPSLITPTAAESITVANTIKNSQGAKIYSVGVEAGANPNAAFTSSSSGVTTDWRGNFVSYDFNRFLHAVSSNYPSAASMSNLKTGDKGAGYYMAVNNTASLSKIFDNILYNTVYELKTFDKATLSYTLTSNFILTMEQELAMREALAASGLTDADIVVTRNADNTTNLTFRNVPVKRDAVNGTAGYYATVRFDVSAAKDASGTIATGSESGVSYGSSDKAVSVDVADVTIPANRSVVVFKLNGKVYRMVDAAQGDAITVPMSELAAWSIPDGATVDSAYAEFDATVVDTHSITWVIDGANTVQSYRPGDAVSPPTAAKDGYIFTGWMPAAPSMMPAHDMTCIAAFTAHTHQWVETYKTGTCDTGITTHYVCAACGEGKSETSDAHAHNYTAVLSDNGSAGTKVEKLVCTDCGHSENQEVSFKVTQSKTGRSTVLELNRFENDQLKPGATDKELEMRYYIGDDGGKTYRVTRIDADGTRTVYSAKSEDGYLVFKLNHFSIYVIGELEGEAGQEQEVETLSYAESTQLLETAQPIVDNTPLAENQSSSGNSKADGSADNSDNSGSSGTSNGSSGSRYSGGSGGGGSSGSSRSVPAPAVSTKSEEGKQKNGVWSNPFADVAENAYYYKAVAWASQHDVTLGTSKAAFSPSKTCSRGEIVTFLWRAKGCPEPALTTNPFADLDENAYYYKAALWAYENGVTNGAGATSFAPDADCTRAQVVTFLWRAEGKPTVSSAAVFADVSGSDYYTEAVAWAAAREITNGTGNGKFSPALVCTRAQIVTFLYRDLAEEAAA